MALKSARQVAEHSPREYLASCGPPPRCSPLPPRSSRAQLGRVGPYVLEGAGEEECLLGERVGLALEDVLERGHGVLDRDVGAGPAGAHLGDEERLRVEALEPAGRRDG